MSVAGLLSFFALVVCVQAASPALLDEAVHKWEGERDNWAFTQFVREFDNGRVKQERFERYDPSQPDHRRWQLLLVNGRAPTENERAAWQTRKTKKRKPRPEKPLDHYFDFARATVAGETDELVRYAVPLRKDAIWLVPVEKIAIDVTVSKRTRSLEQVSAGLREPFKVALGVARVADGALNVRFAPSGVLRNETADAVVHASGNAHVVVFKFGERAEYAWSDFKRVVSYRERLGASLTVRSASGS